MSPNPDRAAPGVAQRPSRDGQAPVLPLELTAEQTVSLLRLEHAWAARAATRGNADRAESHLRRAFELFDAVWLTFLLPVAAAVAGRFARSARKAGLEPADLIQEAYLKCRSAIAAFLPELGTPLRAWLGSVLKRHFIGLLRRHRPTDPLPPGDVLPAGEDDPAEDPQELRAELQRLAARALAGDPRRRQKIAAFLLYHCQGWTMAQLGRRYAVATSTVFRWLGEVREAVGRDLSRRYPFEFAAPAAQGRDAGTRPPAGAPSTVASGSAKQA
jgi:RNA polymerase sigma factor (sigma-70 family)